MNNDKLILSRTELMKELGISYTTVQRWEKQGMPVIRVEKTSQPKYKLSAVEMWLDAKQQINNDLDK